MSLTHRLRVYWLILRTSMAERFAYRSDFALGTLFRFLPIITQIFLWGAIFRTMGSQGGADQIAGYRYGEMVAYYLMAMLARAFSSMPGLSSGIARDIREGTLKKYLIQPIDMLGYLFWYRVAHKLVYYFVATIPFTIVFYLCRSYFPGWPDAGQLAGLFVALNMAFLLGFLIESLLGLIAFWFLEVSSLLFIYMMLNYFLSGHMIPLDLLPAWAQWIIDFLPFKFLAYFPCALALNKYDHVRMMHELSIGAGWIVGLLILNRWVFARGLRRYGAYGG
ncbi:MAG: ABC transporter permease [Planctomycetota bacterium]|nr:MAG: ABC transporter permease [Planctomycetota bacterium]